MGPGPLRNGRVCNPLFNSRLGRRPIRSDVFEAFAEAGRAGKSAGDRRAGPCEGSVSLPQSLWRHAVTAASACRSLTDNHHRQPRAMLLSVPQSPKRLLAAESGSRSLHRSRFRWFRSVARAIVCIDSQCVWRVRGLHRCMNGASVEISTLSRRARNCEGSGTIKRPSSIRNREGRRSCREMDTEMVRDGAQRPVGWCCG